MTLPTLTPCAPDLEPALEELTCLGIALIRTFNTGPFPVRSRLARNIRAVLTPRTASAAFPDAIGRADTMLRQIDALQAAIAGLPDIDDLQRHRLVTVVDALAAYREFLLAAAGPAPRAGLEDRQITQSHLLTSSSARTPEIPDPCDPAQPSSPCI
jgi:hypothetical protein